MDRDELLADLTLKMYTLERDKPPGWQDEHNLLKAQFSSMTLEQPKQPEVSGRNLGSAVINRMIRAGAGMGDAAARAVNWSQRQLQGDYELDEEGFAIHDPTTGMRVPRSDLVPVVLRDLAETAVPKTSIDILGDTPSGRRWGAVVDATTDATMYTLGLSPAFAGTAKIMSRTVPYLHKVTRPFETLEMGRDVSSASIAGMGGGYFADEEGNSSILAEFLTPLAAQGLGGGFKLMLNRIAPGASGGIDAIAERDAAALLKKALLDEGMSVDEAVEIYASRGAEGLPGDISDSFRTLLREANAQNAITGRDRRMLRERVEGDLTDATRTGSTGRINSAIGRELGTVDGKSYVDNLNRLMKEDIDGLYASARARGSEPLPDQINLIIGERGTAAPQILSPDWGSATEVISGVPIATTADGTAAEMANAAMQRAKNSARQMQLNETGTHLFQNNFDYIDAIKKDLDDQWRTAHRAGETNMARSILSLKNRLTGAADSHFPGYREARDLFAGKAQLEAAVEMGQEMFGRSMNATTLEELVNSMSASEASAFLVGARDSLLESIYNAPINQSAGARLTRTPEQLEKLRIVFDKTDSPDSLGNFLRAVEREGEFIKTRNFILGGSQTFDKYAASENFRKSINALQRTSALGELGKASIMAQVLDGLSRNRQDEKYLRSLVMAGDILLNSNIDKDALRQVLTSGNVRSLLTPISWQLWGKENVPSYVQNALRGGSFSHISEMMTAERDRLEREQDEADRTRRQQAEIDSRNLSPGTVAVGI